MTSQSHPCFSSPRFSPSCESAEACIAAKNLFHHGLVLAGGKRSSKINGFEGAPRFKTCAKDSVASILANMLGHRMSICPLQKAPETLITIDSGREINASPKARRFFEDDPSQAFEQEATRNIVSDPKIQGWMLQILKQPTIVKTCCRTTL